MPAAATQHTVLIIGAGAAGIAVASSLLARDRSLDIALVDPAEVHYGGKLAPSFPRWLLDGRKPTQEVRS
jgi:NADH dehydrogenase FAD-containing subunit